MNETKPTWDRSLYSYDRCPWMVSKERIAKNRSVRVLTGFCILRDGHSGECSDDPNDVTLQKE